METIGVDNIEDKQSQAKAMLLALFLQISIEKTVIIHVVDADAV